MFNRNNTPSLSALSGNFGWIAKATGLVLVAAAVWGAIQVFGPGLTTNADFTCPADTECPYDSSGDFIGYKNPWPPGCIYIIPGAKSKPSVNMFNPMDSNASTTAPICRPSPVPPFRVTYYERGHRMRNVGTYIDTNGCAQKFRADGSSLGVECFNGGGLPANNNQNSTAPETPVVEAATELPTDSVTQASAEAVKSSTTSEGPSFPVAVGSTFKYTSNDAIYYLDNGNCKKKYEGWDMVDAWHINRGSIVTIWDTMHYPDCASPLVDPPPGR